ncbi:MAG: DUF4232 domain-containing protein [Acidimicrobiales bacterium]|jgi:hypothetical protein
MVGRLAALVAAGVVSAGLAGCSNGTAIKPDGPDSGIPTIPTTTHPPDSSPVRNQATCQNAQLRARVTSGGSEASQPFVIIALTNNGPSCSINGYPRIVSALGSVLSGGWVLPLPIAVADGPDYEHPDPGPRPTVLRRGSAVSFALGTNTASGTVYTITALSVILPGDSSPLKVPVHTLASAFAGSPVKLAVTAFGPGSTGPPTG